MTESELLSRITIDPGKMHGKPCIRGLRMRVSDLLDYLASGMSRQDILKEFPELEDADLDAALLFASRALQGRSFIAAE